MTDSNRLADYDIKAFGKLTSNQSIASYFDKVCLECRNNHSFSGNLDYAITFIDLLPKLFPGLFKENRNGGISTTNLQEFVN
jgi:hypothetical protein